MFQITSDHKLCQCFLWISYLRLILPEKVAYAWITWSWLSGKASAVILGMLKVSIVELTSECSSLVMHYCLSSASMTKWHYLGFETLNYTKKAARFCKLLIK